MNYEPIPSERILAIDPITKGFGFVVLESEPLQLLDWGTASCRRTDDSLGNSIRTLLARYHPTALVLEDGHRTLDDTPSRPRRFGRRHR